MRFPLWKRSLYSALNRERIMKSSKRGEIMSTTPMRDASVKLATILYDYLSENEAIEDESCDLAYELVEGYEGGDLTDEQLEKAGELEFQIWQKAYALLGQYLINMSLVWDRLTPLATNQFKCHRCESKASFTVGMGDKKLLVCGVYHAVPPIEELETPV